MKQFSKVTEFPNMKHAPFCACHLFSTPSRNPSFSNHALYVRRASVIAQFYPESLSAIAFRSWTSIVTATMSPISPQTQPITLPYIHAAWTTALALPPISRLSSLRYLLRSVTSSSPSQPSSSSGDNSLSSTNILHPKSLASLYLDLALTYAFLGKYESASLSFQEAATVDIGNAFALFGLGLAKAELRKWKSAKRNWGRCLRCFESERHGRREAITYRLAQGKNVLAALRESSGGGSIPSDEWMLERKNVKRNYDVALIQIASKRNAGLLSQEAIEQVKGHGLNGIPAGISCGPNWDVHLQSLVLDPAIANAAQVPLSLNEIGSAPTQLKVAKTWPTESKKPIALPTMESFPEIPPLQYTRTWPTRVESVAATTTAPPTKPLPPIPALQYTKSWPSQSGRAAIPPIDYAPLLYVVQNTQRIRFETVSPPPKDPLPPLPPIATLHFTQRGFEKLAALPTTPLPPVTTLRDSRKWSKYSEGVVTLPPIPAVSDEESSVLSPPPKSTGVVHPNSDDSPTLGRQPPFPIRTSSLNDPNVSEQSLSTSSSQTTVARSSSDSSHQRWSTGHKLPTPIAVSPFTIRSSLIFAPIDSFEKCEDLEVEGRVDGGITRPKGMLYEGDQEMGNWKGEGGADDDQLEKGKDREAGDEDEVIYEEIYDEADRSPFYEDDNDDMGSEPRHPHQNPQSEEEILLPRTFEGFGPRR